MRNDQETILRKIRWRWITAAAVTVLIAGWFFSWRLVEQADRNMRIDLLQQVQLIGQTLNVERVQALSGTDSDRHGPDFQRLQEQFLTLCSANPQCRDLYLLGRRADGAIFFLVHSDPDQGKDGSRSGKIPAEASDAHGSVFARQTPMVAGPNTDFRGPWVSGLVPIHDPQAALFGLATPADARAMVQRAAAYYRINGRERLLREINNPQGSFVQKDLYVFAYDSGMTMLAHPVKPELVGKNQLAIKDWPGGKYFRQEIRDVALAQGSGWVDYEYENPANKMRDSKTTYVERVDDLIICAGAYKGTGATLAVLGMDLDARDWNRALIRTALPSGLCTLALAAILLAGGALSARRSRPAQAQPSWMQHLETALVVAVGAMLSVLMAWEVHQQELRGRSQVFGQQMASQTQSIVTTLHTLRDTELEGLAHFYDGSEDVTADEFRQFSRYLTKNPAIAVWQWIPVVTAGERSRFEASARAAGQTSFAIWQKNSQGRRIPAAERGAYYPVFRIAPMAGNEPMLGYDIGSEPLPLAALEAAARSRLPGATVSQRLLLEADEQKGLQIFRPVFGGPDAKQLRGFVQPVLRLETLLRSGAADSAASLELSLLHRDALPETLATTWDADSPPGTGLIWRRAVFAFGKVFGITAYARPEFLQMHPLRTGWLTLLVGLTLTAALAFVVRATGHRREELERLVTERTLALQESEQSYRNQFANNAAMMLLIDPGDGAILDANGAAAAFYGFSREQLLTMQLADIDILSPAEVQQALASVPQGLGKRFECRHRLADGTLREVEVLASSIQFAGGTVLNAIIHDITERKSAEEKLRENVAWFKALFNATSDSVFLIDRHCTILDLNEKAAQRRQVERAAMLGRNLLEFLPVEAAAQRRAAVAQIIEQGRLIQYEEARGEQHYSIRLFPIRDESGQVLHVASFSRDIGERKQAEAEKAILESQLRQSQKMEAVGQLAGGVAHDFNNMLGVILGYTELLLEEVGTEERFQRQLHEIRKAAERSANLTRQLLTFARKQTVAPKVLDLNQTVEGMLNMLRRLIGEDIDLVWRPGAGLWPIKMDPSQIDQILANLCVNARDAIAGVGTLTVATENSILDAQDCAGQTGFVPGEYVRLTVSDTGRGMDQAILARIFEPFFTTKDVGVGTGLGLATVYGAVKQNDGFVYACSEAGQGATFTIYLPRHVGQIVSPGPGDADNSAPRGSETVLLVEDESVILEMVKVMLESLGYTVLAANTPGVALRLAEEYAGAIHLLVTDVIMPEMNGRDLAEKLWPLHPHLKCLFMSGYTADVIAHHGVLDEGVQFIQKPFLKKDLSAKVREVLTMADAANTG